MSGEVVSRNESLGVVGGAGEHQFISGNCTVMLVLVGSQVTFTHRLVHLLGVLNG